MVKVILLLDSAEDRDGVLDGRLRNEDRLETARERRVLFDVFAVFVEGRGADAMKFAAGQGGFQEVRRVDGSLGGARADKGVHFIDEQDDLTHRVDDLVQYRLQAFLEFAAKFRPGKQGAQIQHHQTFVLKRLGNVPVDDPLRQAFDDRGLADARFADQHRVVLRAPGQHLNGAADFLVAADDRIQLAAVRLAGEIPGILLQGVVGIFGRRRIGGTPLAHLLDGRIQRLGRHAGIRQNPVGFGVGYDRQC